MRAKSADDLIVTTFVFNVRNIPAALYKAMGGFATNGINMTKLESYQIGGNFTATQFYADIEGHPDDENVKRALEELRFFSEEVRILGVYKAHPMRSKLEQLSLFSCTPVQPVAHQPLRDGPEGRV